MSYYDEQDFDPSPVTLRSAVRTARRTLRRTCEICGWYIQAGEVYNDVAFLDDGEFIALVSHRGRCPDGNVAKREAAEAIEQTERDALIDQMMREEWEAIEATP